MELPTIDIEVDEGNDDALYEFLMTGINLQDNDEVVESALQNLPFNIKMVEFIIECRNQQ
jgi:hypothetical protein